MAAKYNEIEEKINSEINNINQEINLLTNRRVTKKP